MIACRDGEFVCLAVHVKQNLLYPGVHPNSIPLVKNQMLLNDVGRSIPSTGKFPGRASAIPMNTSNEPQTRNSDLIVLLLTILAASVLFHVASAVKGYGIYRDIHLGTALHYAQTRIDLAHTVIVGFNATDTPTIQELPLWQALVAVAFKILGPWQGWANVVSLVIFLTCLWPIFQVTQASLGRRTALWTLVFFMAQPLIFEYAGMASTDGLCMVSAIWFWYFLVNLIRDPNPKWLLLACFAGSLTAVSKLPFFVADGIAAFLFIIKEHGISVKRLLYLIAVGGVATVLFFLWTKCTDAAQSGAVFPLVDLRVSHNPQMLWWYFGDWHYRLSPGNWIKGGWRIFNSLFGSFVLVGLAAFSITRKNGDSGAKCLAAAAMLTTLVFSHLVLQHSHYYMMFSLSAAILSAQTVAGFEPACATCVPRPCTRAACIGLLLALSLIQGFIGRKVVYSYDTYPAKMARIIRENTKESDKLVIQGGGWGGDQLTRSNRRGLSIWNTKIFEDAANYARLKSMGFNKLVMISESPLMDALQRVNPGETNREREVYKSSAGPIINDWPTIFQSDDILIKEIP